MEKEQKVEIRKTITSIFMVPTLRIPRETLRENNILNGYAKDSMSENIYEDSVYLLFRPSQIDKFREFLEGEYERTKSIIDDYDYPNGFVVVVYKLNPEFAYDFHLIKQGKYSRTSPAFQNEFPKTVTIVENGVTREEISLQCHIFNRTDKLVKFWEEKFGVDFNDDQEVWRGWEEEDETLTEDKLKEYEQQ